MEIKERMVWMGMNEGGINEGRKGRNGDDTRLFAKSDTSSQLRRTWRSREEWRRPLSLAPSFAVLSTFLVIQPTSIFPFSAS